MKYVIPAALALMTGPQALACSPEYPVYCEDDDGLPDELPTYEATDTWVDQVGPIVEGRCMNCHSEGNGAPDYFGATQDPEAQAEIFYDLRNLWGPYVERGLLAHGWDPEELLRYNIDLAEDRSRATADDLWLAAMPPWSATHGLIEQDLSELALSEHQIETLFDWVDAYEECEAGSYADCDGSLYGEGIPVPLAEPSTVYPFHEGHDQAVVMPVDGWDVSFDGSDQYLCQVFPAEDWLAGVPGEVAVTGVRVNVDQPEAHHVLAYLVPPEAEIDPALTEAPYDCTEGMFGDSGETLPVSLIGGWAPGTDGAGLPDGTGIAVEAGARLLVQNHYNFQGEIEVHDETEVVISHRPLAEIDHLGEMYMLVDYSWPACTRLEEELMERGTPPERIERILDGMNCLELPPDTSPQAPYVATHQVQVGAITGDRAVDIYSTQLHMHRRGLGGAVSLHTAAGEQPLTHLADYMYDFGWQRGYWFPTPVRAEPTDELTLECRWLNSDPYEVGWGEGSGDEMCIAFFYGVQRP